LHIPYWAEEEDPKKDPPRWTMVSPLPPLLEAFEALVRADERAAPVQEPKEIAELVEGMEVSIDVSTGDHDSGNRLFGTVTLAQENQGSKHGLILLVQDPEANFKTATPPAQPAVQEPDADALDGDIDLFDDARSILEIIVHDQPADLFRDARALIPKLRARIGMPPITTMTAAPRAVD
jgi:hypothetical protein